MPLIGFCGGVAVTLLAVALWRRRAAPPRPPAHRSNPALSVDPQWRMNHNFLYYDGTEMPAVPDNHPERKDDRQ